MLKFVKIPLVAVMLSSVAVATVTVVAATDAAYARSEKARGGPSDKGQGNGNGQTIFLHGKSANHKGSNGGGSKGGNRGFKGFTQDMQAMGNGFKSLGSDVSGAFGKLTGQDKKAARMASYDGELRPNQLGNMNGALHANENAILAHIRNGNTNGPVGMMAELAVAKAGADAASQILDGGLAQDYLALDSALAENNFASYADYQTYLADGGAPIDAIDQTYADLGTSDLNAALATANYGSYQEYADAVAADPTKADINIDAAYSNLGVYDQGFADTVASAEGDLANYDTAKADALAYWNKGGDATPEQQDALIGMLETRIDSYTGVEDAIAAADASASADATTSGDGTTCAAGDTTCDPELASTN